MRVLGLLPLIAILIGSTATPAMAAPGPDRVSLLEDARTDYALRLRLIQNASQSLDLIESEHTSEPQISMPLLLALRDAAARGVRIRMISGFFPSVFSHSTRDLRRILGDPGLKAPPQLILDGLWFRSPIRSPDATMWTSFDEKILIADGSQAVLGGRNVGDAYLHWQDNSLYLDGPVVSNLSQFFERTWKLATTLYKVGGRNSALAGSSEAYGPFKLSAPLAQGQAEAARLEASPTYQPESIEVLANGLIGRMTANPGRHGPAPTPDPVLETFLKLARHSKRAYYYSLFPAADARMAEGLAEAVRNGSTVALITNSLESSRNLSSPPLPYYGCITSMIALARAGVAVYQWTPTPDNDFMHEKLAIVDDVVIYGSHNFNYSSTHGYDQLDVAIHDPALADLLARRFEEQAATHARPVTAEFLGWQKAHAFVGVEISKLLLGLY
jgi:phosphatidylserine/phosphatidylglycerophosphate/cardiolipin synthase-like enzyme